jgi:ribonuclease J
MMRGADELLFVALGGVGEIGMNLALYGFGPPSDRKWLAVDMGVAFGHEEVLPGVDAVLPDIGFLLERKAALQGIVITHAHEDHYGALSDFWPLLEVPVYMTPFAAGLLEAKRAMEPNAPKIPVTVVKQRDRIRIGPFEVEYVPVSHSIPEPNALAIRTSLGTVFHTGDWKRDPAPGLGLATDDDRIAAIGEEGVLALVSDSTNAVREGISPSEGEVALALERLIAAAPQRVAVTTFASNVARLRAVAAAAHRAGRQVVVIGRAIRRALEVAGELGYLEGLPEFLDQEAYGYLPRDKVVALMTGSQGEPNAALARIASGDHRAVALSAGDRIIFSSRTIPGNERAVNTIINALIDMGAEVITDRDGLVHTSGHARRSEIRQLYDWIKPTIVIPVHGEALHLHEQAKIARAADVPQVIEARNGDLIRLAPGRAEKLDRIRHGRLYRDGRLLVSDEASGVRARLRLGFAGVVSIAVVLADNGDILEDPAITMLGIPEAPADGESLRAIVEAAIDDALDSLPKPKRRDGGLVREAVHRAARSAVDSVWGKRPSMIVHVTHVSD